MMGAGLLAKKAVARGLTSRPWVKTSLAPGSKVVTAYLEEAGLLEPLAQLGFDVVGYGCTTCIGNSGPLLPDVTQRINDRGLVVAAVLSGNRNFEGRIHPLVRANYLASPPLVVAYALAGSMTIDLTSEPLGHDSSGTAVFLRDLWPSRLEIQDAMGVVTDEMFKTEYATVFEGDDRWRSLEVPVGDGFEWDAESTYIRHPPFFEDMDRNPRPVEDVRGARVLAVLGDSITTDHISPAGAIPADGPAGRYLVDHGVSPSDFNSFGARRGNHEVMVRGRSRTSVSGICWHPERRAVGRRSCRTAGSSASTMPPCATARRVFPWSCWRARNMDRDRRVTGQPRGPSCSGCERSSRRVTSEFIGATW